MADPGQSGKVENESEGLSSTARASQLASECLSIAISMVVPGLLALWVDNQLETNPVLTIVGFMGGFAYGVWRLSQLGKRQPSRKPQDK